MKHKINKVMSILLLAASIVSSTMPSMTVRAADYTSETRYICGDGVCFRKTGSETGEVLGLMYYGEKIKFYPYILGEDTEYNYMYRYKQSLYGYVNHDYTRVEL